MKLVVCSLLLVFLSVSHLTVPRLSAAVGSSVPHSTLFWLSGAVDNASKPRIDFKHLLSVFPDLPWDFEIRYLEKNGRSSDMLRIHYDGKVDLVRWRPEYEGSLASVCHSDLEEKEFRRLLELLRDTKFNDLPSEPESLMSVALRGEAIISIRLGKLIVRKIDRGNLNSKPLAQIEDALSGIGTTVAVGPKSSCEMESVPAQP